MRQAKSRPRSWVRGWDRFPVEAVQQSERRPGRTNRTKPGAPKAAFFLREEK
jgi:hypothetical protein